MNSGVKKKEIIDQQSLELNIDFMKTFMEILSQKNHDSPSLMQLKKLKSEISECFQLFKEKKQIYLTQISSLNSVFDTFYESQRKVGEDNSINDDDSDSDSINELQDENDDSRKKLSRNQDHKSVNKSEQSNIPNNPKGFDSNPLNVWKISEQFFQKLPSNHEIDQMFESKLIEYDFDSLSKHPSLQWTSKLSKIANKSKNGAKTLPEPPPQQKLNFEQFWNDNPPSFQIEQHSMDNANVFHYLLNSFVEVDGEEDEEDEDEESLETSKNETSTNVIEPDSYPLINQIPNSAYLSLDFQTRLNLELESAGCGTFTNESNCDSFIDQIQDTYHKIEDEYQPEMNRLHEMIMKNMPEYRSQEDARINSEEIYRLIKSETQSKRSRKK